MKNKFDTINLYKNGFTPLNTTTITIATTTTAISKFVFALFLFLLITTICTHGQTNNNDCDNKKGLLTFELITGYVLTAPTRVLSVLPSVVNLIDCLEKCRTNYTCKSLNFKTGLCVLFTSSYDESHEFTALSKSQHPVFTTFAQKICLIDKKKSCKNGWAFERVIGYRLKLLDKKRASVSSASECMQLCLDETQFECRSFNYDSGNRQCALSDMNRHIINANNDVHLRQYGPSLLSSVDYYENNCIREPTKFCDFRRINGQILKTVDSVYADIRTLSDCKEKCLNSAYHCHSFDFSSEPSYQCRTSHLNRNSLTHIDDPYLTVSDDSVTYELAMCYNVTISCRAREMVAKVRTSKLFDGKIYAKSKPNRCVNDVSNSLEFDIRMQYSGGDNCDVKQSSAGHFTNDIVIQHHDMVVTTRDLALGVYCKFDIDNETISSVDLAIDGDILTDRLRGETKLPDLSLHIVDNTGEDIEAVSLGDLLRVQVRMSDEATYGIFVRNLIAKDGTGYNNLTLIDNTGCPVEGKMMREVRTISKERKSLESYLEAFTFTGSSTLELEAEVETCLDRCRPVQCQIISGRSDDDFETVMSYGRRRRRRRSPVTDLEMAEKGDILSLTTLSSAVTIQTKSNAKPKKAVKPIKKVSAPVNSAYRKGKNLVTPESFKFKIRLDSSDGFYCFEPTTLATLCGVTLFIQAFMFTAAFIVASKIKRRKTKILI